MKLAVGKRVRGVVVDAQDRYVSVDIHGLNGIINLKDIGWGWIIDCRQEVSVGQEVECEIVAVDIPGLEIRLSRRACLPNPLATLSSAAIEGTPFTFTVSGVVDDLEGRLPFAVGVIDGGIPAKLPADEYDWGSSSLGADATVIATSVPVVGLRLNTDKGLVVVSRKRRAVSKWEEIRAKYTKDLRAEAIVVSVDARGAFCELEPGVLGFVPAEEFHRAGFEYRDYATTLLPGHRLFVAVSRVVAGEKNRVNLLLQQNLRS